MSIIAYVGLPGSGKSYDVVANQILPALKDDRRVVTNVPLNRDEVRRTIRSGEIVELPLDVVAQEPHKIDEYATPGCVLIIDELWRFWPAGEKAHRIPQPYKSLLAEHRHRVDSQGRAMQIVFVTQDLSQIAAFARQLVEQTFHHTKLTHVGQRGSYRIDVFHGAVTGAVPPVNNRLREIFGKYQPRIFKMYQSHTMSDSHQSGADENTIDARANIFRRWSFWAAGAGALVALAWGVSTLYGLVAQYGGDDASVASPFAADPLPEPVGSIQAFPSTPPKAGPARIDSVRHAGTFRLVGWIENLAEPDRSLAVVSNGTRQDFVPLNRCRPNGTASYVCEYRGVTFDVFGSL